ncbi:hypothetical protein [Pseudomonas lundensis]|uniref:hypothetical protein n=1 Tax=Pseudomonas lundensis TaxID=86185 RepID=UPI00089DD400|nr:hypothetical protein [Pseudomonas lundensis]
MKIEGLTIEVIPKPGTEEFDQLAKQFAEAVYNNFCEMWRLSNERQAALQCGFLAAEPSGQIQPDSDESTSQAQKA